ncbi:AraC family transcriptional regulator [Exiguobacterium flavidum]|uniref:AraC family transcriptional regulator n=1 Tax=Exiguobacterium flavidum TaxID=2184695 RepID=UPI001300A2E0|nr:AraC family transcriptional regulator [Exiguobacterium flavidum]
MTIALEGKIGVRLDSREFRLQDGEAILIRPGVTHSPFNPVGAGSFALIRFKRAAFEEWIRRQAGTESAIELDESQYFVPFALKQELARWTKHALEGGRSLEELEDDCFAYLADHLSGELPTIEQASSSDPIATVLAYIETHFAEPIRIETLSAIALQSKYQFIRSFKQATGFTPYQYVTWRRLARAKELLRYSDANLLQISLAVGFSSPAQFNGHFAKWVGCSPARFRENRGHLVRT